MRRRFANISSVVLVLLATSAALIVSTKKLDVSQVLGATGAAVASVGVVFSTLIAARPRHRDTETHTKHKRRYDDDM